MKILYFLLALLLIPFFGNSQQSKIEFESAMQEYVDHQMQEVIPDDLNHTLEHVEEDMSGDFSQELRENFIRNYYSNQYIKNHPKAYNKLIESQMRRSKGCDDVCFNGGFEDGFECYGGEFLTYNSQIFNCDAGTGTSVLALPANDRFEIMTSGTDPIVPQLQRTMFDEHSARINSQIGHATGRCNSTGLDINRLTKNFTVTNDNQNFSIWYAIVLQNPNGHTNQQPYFSIAVRAGGDELMFVCIDAEDGILTRVEDQPCGEPYLWRDWSCSNILIPDEFIGQEVTLEVTAADCGLGAHSGWAYVDGICESCEGSADGSITIVPPEPCSTQVCGSYTLPTGGTSPWDLVGITIDGAVATNLVIDETTMTYCFDLTMNDFPNIDPFCIDVRADASFSNATDMASAQSTTLTICRDEQFCGGCLTAGVIETICDNQGTTDPNDDTWSVIIEVQDPLGNGTFWRSSPVIEAGSYDSQKTIYMGSINVNSPFELLIYDDGDPSCNTTLSIDVPESCSEPCDLKIDYSVKECDDAGTPNMISDDFYYVELVIDGASGQPWMVKQKPENGGPDVLLEQGTGNTTLTLGPFLISDGDWSMWVFYSDYYDCLIDVYIKAPDYCSGCHEVEIANIECNNQGTEDPDDDTWSFDILVDDGPGDYWTADDPVNESGPYGDWKTIYMGEIANYNGTISFIITDSKDPDCSTEVEIAVPEPCSISCKLDIDYKVTECDDAGTSYLISDDFYYVELEISDTNGEPWMVKQKPENGGPDVVIAQGSGDASITLGPFLISDGDWTMWVFLSDYFDCLIDVYVQAPEYCSGCHDVEIANVQCINNGSADPDDDQWTFDVFIEGGSGYWTMGSPINESGPYGQWKTIWMGPISNYNGPVTFTITDSKDPDCVTVVEIFPPRPCSEECKLETDIGITGCELDRETGTWVYYVKLTVSGTNKDCWMAKKKNADGSDELLGSYNGDQTVTLGPFAPGEDWTLWVFICEQFDCVMDYYINAPDCDGGEGFKEGKDEKLGLRSSMDSKIENQMQVFPNPSSNNYVYLHTNFEPRNIQILDLNFNLISLDQKIGTDNRIDISNLQSGLYFILANDENNELVKSTFIKI